MVGEHALVRHDLDVADAGAVEQPLAACAPVMPVAARTFAYLLKADLRQLAHSDSAGRREEKRSTSDRTSWVVSLPAPAKAPCKVYNTAGGAGISTATLPGPSIVPIRASPPPPRRRGSAARSARSTVGSGSRVRKAPLVDPGISGPQRHRYALLGTERPPRHRLAVDHEPQDVARLLAARLEVARDQVSLVVGAVEVDHRASPRLLPAARPTAAGAGSHAGRGHHRPQVVDLGLGVDQLMVAVGARRQPVARAR